MSDVTQQTPKRSLLVPDQRTKKRNAAEKRFRAYGVAAIGVALTALVFLLVSIFANGAGAFQQTYITLNVELPSDKLDKKGNRNREEMAKVSTFGYAPLIKDAINAKIEEAGITIDGLKKPQTLISKEAAAQLRNFVLANPDVWTARANSNSSPLAALMATTKDASAWRVHRATRISRPNNSSLPMH